MKLCPHEVPVTETCCMCQPPISVRRATRAALPQELDGFRIGDEVVWCDQWSYERGPIVAFHPATESYPENGALVRVWHRDRHVNALIRLSNLHRASNA
jgi:hypothetical protein